MKANILADFQICISVPLRLPHYKHTMVRKTETNTADQNLFKVDNKDPRKIHEFSSR